MEADSQRLRTAVAAVLADPVALEAAVNAAREQSAVITALPREETARHTVAVLSASVAAFSAGRPLSERDLATAARLGADRAEQDVPLAALLDGFQAARTAVLRTAIGRLRDIEIGPATLLDSLVELDGLVSELERALTHAHHATELERVRTARDQRALVLRQVLLGDPEIVGDVLGPLGLDPSGRYHCLVSAEHDARAAHQLEARLSAIAGGVYGLFGGYLVGLVPRLRATGVLAPAVGDTLLVAAPAAAVDALPRLYRMCCAARDAAIRQGRRGALPLAELAVDVALDGAPALGTLLADALLGALEPATVFHRELVSTALTHLEHGGRLDATAAALHVHPNTVKYRLRRLRELTGFTAEPPAEGGPDAVRHVVRWGWALRSWLDAARPS